MADGKKIRKRKLLGVCGDAMASDDAGRRGWIRITHLIASRWACESALLLFATKTAGTLRRPKGCESRRGSRNAHEDGEGLVGRVAKRKRI